MKGVTLMVRPREGDGLFASALQRLLLGYRDASGSVSKAPRARDLNRKRPHTACLQVS